MVPLDSQGNSSFWGTSMLRAWWGILWLVIGICGDRLVMDLLLYTLVISDWTHVISDIDLLFVMIDLLIGHSSAPFLFILPRSYEHLLQLENVWELIWCKLLGLHGGLLPHGSSADRPEQRGRDRQLELGQCLRTRLVVWCQRHVACWTSQCCYHAGTTTPLYNPWNVNGQMVVVNEQK